MKSKAKNPPTIASHDFLWLAYQSFYLVIPNTALWGTCWSNGELGRTDYQTKRCFIIIKYWLKIVNSAERKYITYIYNTMLVDIEENDRKINWALLVKR